MLPYYPNVQALLEDLQDHPVELLHNSQTTKHNGVWKTFTEFKQGIENVYNIEFYNTQVEYEDENGIFQKIGNEHDYFEAVKTVDGLRFFLKVEFDDKKVSKAVAQPANVPLNTTPWACRRCQARNGPENLRCKVCSQARS